MHDLGVFNFLLTTILTGIVLFIGYYLNQQSKVTRQILEKITSNFDSPAENFTADLADYGLKNGDPLPALIVSDSISRKTVNLDIIDVTTKKETLLLITGAGCGSCEETLVSLSNYNLQRLDQNLVVFTFIPPAGIEEFVIKRHIGLAQNVTTNNFIISEEILVTLDVRTFPTLMRVSMNGNVLGTYRGNKDQVKNFLKFTAEPNVS